jgi:apolipoprotein N-acyltransferase
MVKQNRDVGPLQLCYLTVLAAGVCSVGIVTPALWFLVFPGLALFFYILLTYRISAWKLAWYGMLFGTLTGCAGTVWFLNTLPLDFLGIRNHFVQACAVGMTWLYVGASLGAPLAVTAPLVHIYRSSPLFPIAAALLWTVTETGRMWSFAATTWAPTSLFGPHFSIASIGYPLTESPFLLRMAYPCGIDALNFFAAFVAALLALLPTTIRAKRSFIAPTVQAVVALSLPVALSPSPSQPPSPGQRPVRFAIIAENLEDVRDISSHEVVRELLAKAAAAQPPVNVVLMPEEFSLTSLFWSKEEADTFLKQHFGERDVLILNTRNEVFPIEETNYFTDSKKLVYDSTTSGEVARYVKLMLMPLGEYAPAFTTTFFSVINDPDLQMYLEDVVQLPPPGRSVTSANFHGLIIGGLLCSDILSPSLYHTLSRDHHANVLVNLANQFWFHGSRPLHWKTVQIARVHAVQNNLPFLLANNMAPSFALNGRGEFMVESDWGSRDVLFVSLYR